MLESVIEFVSDVATLIAQSVVGYIADHSRLNKDGWFYYLVKVLVSVIVFLVIIIGIPITVIGAGMLVFNWVFSN